MALLINGAGFSPVTAQQDADLYAGILGNKLKVLDVGNRMAASIIDNNTVRITDGEAVSQGRRIHLDPGSYDDFTIPTGTQGVTSYYIIGYRIYSSEGNELVETFVQSTTATGTITEEQIRDGASESFISFYRIKVVGLTISEVTPMFSGWGIIDVIYPVGSIYMSVNINNPSTLFGGTWVAWGTGRVPVGVDSSVTAFNSVEKTGGERTHTLTAGEMPAHVHKIAGSSGNYFVGSTSTLKRGICGSLSGSGRVYPYVDESASFFEANETNPAGTSQAHNNLQPYITCYMWKRTA